MPKIEIYFGARYEYYISIPSIFQLTHNLTQLLGWNNWAQPRSIQPDPIPPLVTPLVLSLINLHFLQTSLTLFTLNFTRILLSLNVSGILILNFKWILNYSIVVNKLKSEATPQCTMQKLKNWVHGDQVWQMNSLPIFSKNYPNFQWWSLSIQIFEKNILFPNFWEKKW